VVGDSLRDLQAGVAVGCQPHLVRTGKGAGLDAAQLQALCEQVPGTLVHADLTAFADHMIRAERKGRADSGESDSGFGRLD
jgi:D-glycero-D-manno-heptose 1,7-bisphosphate phosphatase